MSSETGLSGKMWGRMGRRKALGIGASGIVGLGSMAAVTGCASPASTLPPSSVAVVGAPAASPVPGAAVTATVAAPKYGGVYRTPVSGEAPHMDTHQTNNNIINVGGISLAYSRLVKLYSGPNRKGEDAEVRG